MQSRHLIPCGGLTISGSNGADTEVLPLNLWSARQDANDITLKVEDLHQGLYRDVPAEFEDLLEIAAYVYCADQATSRGGKNVDGFGDAWRRHFEFTIPVRKPDFWNRPEVTSVLRETLGFLSDDYFDFTFLQGQHPPPMQKYFPDLLDTEPGGEIEGVMLFSGGLDSLAGAVEEAVAQKRRMLLVTHKPTTKLNNVHLHLQKMLAAKAGKFRPTHLRVRIHKHRDLNKNYTQRTRSFLYAAVGATVARMIGLDLVRFYENGVVSMNLPVCAQVVGSRATRTTHPRVLAGFQKLFSLVAESPFRVENPFIWDTKAEVIQRIVRHDCQELIGASVSCAHTWTFSNQFPHCGTCSQCVDRRVAMVAARAEQWDRADGYKSDVFTGERPKDEDRMMVATYVERANQISKLRGVEDLVAQYPEVVRMLRYLPGKPVAMSEKVLALQKRHAHEVKSAVARMLRLKAEALLSREVARDSLLRLAYDSGTNGATVAPAEQPAVQRQEERWEKEKEKADVYRLGRDYKLWRLVYQGSEAVLAEERAVELVDYLLKNPPAEPVHGTVLEVKVDGAPVANGIVGGVIQEGAGARLNGGDDKLLKAKLRELKAASEDESLPETERAEAADQLEQLVKESWKRRQNGGQAGRVAERVRKALRRFIDELKVAERRPGEAHAVLRAFGQHLEECIYVPSVGGKSRVGALGKPGCFTYVRPDGVIWRD